MLAAEAFFFAGMLAQQPKERMTPAWFWSIAVAMLGAAALLGGIDHGFVEPAGLSRLLVQRATWLALAAMTLCVVLTLATQFFTGRISRLVAILGGVQFAGFVIAVFFADSFFVVIVNYAPVMLCLLVLNALHLRRGSGSWQLIAGTLTLFLASAAQALELDAFTPLDHNGLYHVISMPGVYLLFLGGRRLGASRS